MSFRAQAQHQEPVRIIVSGYLFEHYQAFLSRHQLSQQGLLKLSSLKAPGMVRELAELILLMQALTYSQSTLKLTLITANISGAGRYLQEISEGRADIMGESLWHADIQTANNVQASIAVVGTGDFLVGVYVHKDNRQALQISSLKELQQLSFSTNQNWLIDWNTLESLKVKRIYSTNYYPSMQHMVIAGRADALLSGFPSNDDLLLPESQGQLVAIPKVRIALAGSRHFALSNHQANSAKLLAAVNTGLKHLDQQGLIQKAYQESGFFHPKTENWPVLNKTQP